MQSSSPRRRRRCRADLSRYGRKYGLTAVTIPCLFLTLLEKSRDVMAEAVQSHYEQSCMSVEIYCDMLRYNELEFLIELLQAECVTG